MARRRLQFEQPPPEPPPEPRGRIGPGSWVICRGAATRVGTFVEGSGLSKSALPWATRCTVDGAPWVAETALGAVLIDGGPND